MTVSVIIPAYNAAATLEECLRACLNQTRKPDEVIVVDDGSTDGTAEAARALGVRCVRQERAGPAAARNRGARETRGDILVYTDSDCVPEPDWLEALTAPFAEGVAGVGGSYTNANAGCFLADLIQEEIAARHERLGDDVDFLGSFNVAYRREAFEAAGGFDESFRAASGEDNDLAYRLVDNGGRLRFTAKARVAHYHPTRLRAYLRTQMRHGFWRVKLYRKHARRAGRGDRYAGPADLLSPGLALALPMGWVCRALWAWPFAFDAALATVTAAYAVMRGAWAIRLARRRGRLEDAARFLYVVVLRDAARGLGMVRGAAHFLLLGRTTA